MANFIIWRAAYNVGLGYLLRHQSKSFLITRYFTSLTHPEATFYGIIKALLTLNMGSDYDFKVLYYLLLSTVLLYLLYILKQGHAKSVQLMARLAYSG